MNRQKWKELLTKRSTIWTVSLCLVGAIVLGGIASVNSSRDDTDGQSGAQTGQLAYLEEELEPDNSSEGLSADDTAGLEEVSGNIIESDASESSTGTASVSDSDISDAASISDSGISDAASISDSDISDAASISDSDISDAASASGSDTSDAVSASNDIASDGSSSIAAADDPSDHTVEEASSSGILSETALIEAGVSFTEEQSILWPSAGTVIIDYSMDKSVYFATLNQYKYNPALIISSATGNQVLASAKGLVESITIDEETGTTLVLNIGNGYKLTYGQLMEPAVSEGDIVEAGDLLAYISEPTKYYCTEGSNLYFAMTKDGEPVDPVLYLE